MPRTTSHSSASGSMRSGKRGAKVKEPADNPTPSTTDWIEPASFGETLRLHMSRFGESFLVLHRAIIRPNETFHPATLKGWAAGKRLPRSVESMNVLGRIEARYDLPEGYFKSKLPHPGRAAAGHRLFGVTAVEQRRLAWHLPDDFNELSTSEQAEILDWVRTVVISGSTDYRRFQAAASKKRYGLRFPSLTGRKPKSRHQALDVAQGATDEDEDLLAGAVLAPPRLTTELAELIRFKSSTLTDIGFQRSGVWNDETILQKVEHLGLMFGAMRAAPDSEVGGLGIATQKLTLAMLVFPQVWDWYVQWREARRGFFTRWEVDMLRLGAALTREQTGWLRQMPGLSNRLSPIAGMVSQADIDVAKSDWAAACDRFHSHAAARAKEIERVAKVHRDPFEPILPILEAESPVGEYRKIADEVLRRSPCPDRYPRAAAEAARSFLLIRLGLHLGLRQKNLRQMMVCPRGHSPRSERLLENLKRGEIRWSERERGWEVFIPAIAFKNSGSSFFDGRPFRLVLPDLADLNRHIDEYLRGHRPILLGPVDDPGTFFVKTVKATSRSAEYDQNTFYEAWRLVVQRYGIYNPYTGKGVIKGLLPHGPHNIRDVLATHILKQTGSYERASYAIQDTPEMVAKHYGRFLPQDKSALAAQILNQVWLAA